MRLSYLSIRLIILCCFKFLIEQKEKKNCKIVRGKSEFSFHLKFDNWLVADPYLNTDAGTMSPFEHGEVFVLDDGGEVCFSFSFFVYTY